MFSDMSAQSGTIAPLPVMEQRTRRDARQERWFRWLLLGCALLVLASLLMADELHDTRTTLANLQSELARQPHTEAEGRKRLARLADRAEAIAQSLEQT